MPVQESQPRLYEELRHLNLEIVNQGCANTLEVQPTVQSQIKENQKEDEDIKEILKNMRRNKAPGFSEDEHGTVWFSNRICVPDH